LPEISILTDPMLVRVATTLEDRPVKVPVVV